MGAAYPYWTYSSPPRSLPHSTPAGMPLPATAPSGALFSGESRLRERSDRYARPVEPVLTSLTGVVDWSNQFTILCCVLNFQNS